MGRWHGSGFGQALAPSDFRAQIAVMRGCKDQRAQHTIARNAPNRLATGARARAARAGAHAGMAKGHLVQMNQRRPFHAPCCQWLQVKWCKAKLHLPAQVRSGGTSSETPRPALLWPILSVSGAELRLRLCGGLADCCLGYGQVTAYFCLPANEYPMKNPRERGLFEKRAIEANRPRASGLFAAHLAGALAAGLAPCMPGWRLPCSPCGPRLPWPRWSMRRADSASNTCA